MLVMLKEQGLSDGSSELAPDRYVRASDFEDDFTQANNADWRTVAFDASGTVVLPNGLIGFRLGTEARADAGRWNLENVEARNGTEVHLKLSVLEPGTQTHEVVDVAFP